MSSDVVLTSALRSNLLSLQNTQSLIDKTQLRLATGLKVNSALDNPQNFFAAQSLNNRASDLNRLLDGIGQSIRTIEEADNGVTALTSLIEQAQSVASSARDELASSGNTARIVGNVDLSEVADITAATFGGGAIANGDIIQISTVNDGGTKVTENITIATGDTAYSLAAKITDQFADNQDGEIVASVTDQGFLSIESKDGRSFKIGAAAVATDILQAGWTALGFQAGFAAETRTGGVTPLTAATVVAGNTISTVSLYEGSGDLAEANDQITGGTYQDAQGNTILSGATSFQLIVDDNGTTRTTTAVTTSFQDFVDSINQVNAVAANDVSGLIQAEFDNSTGQLKLTSLSDTVRDITVRITANAANDTIDIGLGDPSGKLDALSGNVAAAGAQDFAFRFNNSTQALDSLAKDYNNIRSQIDDIVKDAQYRGVNLLNGDDLTTFFNEDNSSRLVTEGATFTANGLGLSEATFRSSDSIDLTASQARNALESVRSFGSTLANNLSIIQTRQQFTQQTINTLESGADDLTVADGNEEGANLLALQTRQTLGVTSLSLASQSQQSVLRLF